jgi:PHP family Zn ribbon phosphoesterase
MCNQNVKPTERPDFLHVLAMAEIITMDRLGITAPTKIAAAMN